jgi:putative nucleotidyltransferase with HDIG domain
MTAKKVVSKLKKMRPVPAACLSILELLEKRELKDESLIECLNSDRTLANKVLRACNSSHYGFNGSITAVDQAVIVLSSGLIVPIVLTISLRAFMVVPMESYAFEAKELWRHSLATAVVAETFANEGLIPDVEPSTAFAAGLMHDIGKVALAPFLTPETLAAVRQEISTNGLSRIQAERAVLGTDHAEVGAYMLKSMDLPSEIVEAVAHHHQPAVKPKLRLSALTCISNSIVHLAGSAPGWESYAVKMDDDLVKALNLTTEKVELLIMTARDSFRRIERFVDMA